MRPPTHSQAKSADQTQQDMMAKAHAAYSGDGQDEQQGEESAEAEIVAKMKDLQAQLSELTDELASLHGAAPEGANNEPMPERPIDAGSGPRSEPTY